MKFDIVIESEEKINKWCEEYEALHNLMKEQNESDTYLSYRAQKKRTMELEISFLVAKSQAMISSDLYHLVSDKSNEAISRGNNRVSALIKDFPVFKKEHTRNTNELRGTPRLKHPEETRFHVVKLDRPEKTENPPAPEDQKIVQRRVDLTLPKSPTAREERKMRCVHEQSLNAAESYSENFRKELGRESRTHSKIEGKFEENKEKELNSSELRQKKRQKQKLKNLLENLRRISEEARKLLEVEIAIPSTEVNYGRLFAQITPPRTSFASENSPKGVPERNTPNEGIQNSHKDYNDFKLPLVQVQNQEEVLKLGSALSTDAIEEKKIAICKKDQPTVSVKHATCATEKEIVERKSIQTETLKKPERKINNQVEFAVQTTSQSMLTQECQTNPIHAKKIFTLNLNHEMKPCQSKIVENVKDTSGTFFRWDLSQTLLNDSTVDSEEECFSLSEGELTTGSTTSW
eukprot:maker-scaffold_12-snap-gene-10.60-mRNA-1 protein AED:0.68 eAED:0.68 QI:0/1/0.5/1/0/1/2/645/461